MADTERIRPPWWLKPMNKIFMLAMRLGLANFGGESPVVLTVVGRTSGKPRSTPITPFTVDGKPLVYGKRNQPDDADFANPWFIACSARPMRPIVFTN